MGPLISVIIPVYNVEKYLRDCFESVKHQSYTNLEIILIDDGSTDSSGKLCEELANSDKRTKVIHKKNAGLGMARNSGLDIATGEYVAFIDSDDFIDSEMILLLLNELDRFKADTSYCGYIEYYSDGIKKPKLAAYNHQVFKNDEIINKVLLEMISTLPESKKEALLSMSVWHALYSMKIIKQFNLRFPSEREYISEDIIFDIAYLQHAKAVCYIENALYYYRCDNVTSLTHKYNQNEFKRHIKQVNKLNMELEKFLSREDYILRTQRYLLGRLRTCIRKTMRYAEINKNFNYKQVIKNMINESIVKETIKVYPYIKNPWQLKIYNFCIKKQYVTLLIILAKLKNKGKHRRF